VQPGLSVGHRPVGIDRVLSHLPPKVLTAESYRKLTDLLLVPATAKFLHHRTSITDLIITGLHTLPAALRSVAIMSMFSPFSRMLLFVDGLRFLASRTGLPFESLANQIGALEQPDQVAATIRQVVNSLPLSATLPPVEIGGFRRLDTVAEIRDLAKNWQNCLADYLFNVKKVHPQSICRTTGRLFVFCVATAGWAGFCFKPRVRKMRQSSRTNWPKFTQPSPMRASHNLRWLKPSKASLKPMSGHAIIRN